MTSRPGSPSPRRSPGRFVLRLGRHVDLDLYLSPKALIWLGVLLGGGGVGGFLLRR